MKFSNQFPSATSIRPWTALLLITALCCVSLGWACKKSSNSDAAVTKARAVAFAKDIASGLRSAQPLVSQLSPEAGRLLEKGIPIADKIIVAVDASDATSAAALMADLIPTVNELAAQFTGNAKVLAFIALADIGIHFLINHAAEIFGEDMARTDRSARAAGDAIKKYAQQPIWGCQYHPEKCRQ